MVVAGNGFGDYRERAVTNSVSRALLISLLIHFSIFTLIELGYQVHWLQNLLSPRWMRASIERQPDRTTVAKKKAQEINQEPPLLFVNVDYKDISKLKKLRKINNKQNKHLLKTLEECLRKLKKF